MGLLRLDGVSKRFRRGREDVVALDGVELEIDAGEFVSLVGPSGSGKSTLLHLAGGIDQPDDGLVTFDGRDLRRRAGYQICEHRLEAGHLIVHAAV